MSISIWDRIYNDFIQARKDKNEVDKNILALVYNGLKNKAIELKVQEIQDKESIAVIKRVVKQLEEEIESNITANRTKKVNELNYQKDLIHKYLPKQLTEEEIKNILATIEDKSIPNVMKYFKTKYNGLVDMSLVNKIVKEYSI